MRTPNEKSSILYLDDDVQNLQSFAANFRRNYHVITTNSTIEAFGLIQNGGIDIVVTDQNMPSMSGIEFLESVAAEYPQVQRILFTGYSDLISATEAVNKGKIFRIVNKPLDSEEISAALKAACDEVRAKEEKDKLIKDLRRQNQQFEFMLRQRLLS
jgi:DNA-binding NtrC family response regulator